MSDGALTCRELVDFFDERASDAAPGAAFEAHLAACPDCRAYLDAYAATASLARAVRSDADGASPPDLPEDLVQAILRSRRSS